MPDGLVAFAQVFGEVILGLKDFSGVDKGVEGFGFFSGFG